MNILKCSVGKQIITKAKRARIVDRYSSSIDAKQVILNNIRNYIRAYCELLEYPYDVIVGRHRAYEIKTIRFIMMYLLRNKGYTLNSIGQAFYKNHQTVIHGISRANDMLFDKYCQDENSIKIYEKIKDI